MTIEQKEAIRTLVEESAQYLGSQRGTATKVNVSTAIISQILNRHWGKISDAKWKEIGIALGYKDTSWQVVGTTYNMRVMEKTFLDAKKHSMMMAISYPAGSGKTAGGQMFLSKYQAKNTYYIQCREWTTKPFLSNLCRTLGIEQPKGFARADDYLKLIIDFFTIRMNKKPLLIVDEADKLRGGAIRQFIPLYNALEDRLGVVFMGTENLKKEIKNGVRLQRKGYDEIDSRLGRRYIKLYGVNMVDVKRICVANGITNKSKQNEIWVECEPKEVSIGGRFVKMVSDLRRLKRVIQRELIMESEAQLSN